MVAEVPEINSCGAVSQEGLPGTGSLCTES